LAGLSGLTVLSDGTLSNGDIGLLDFRSDVFLTAGKVERLLLDFRSDLSLPAGKVERLLLDFRSDVSLAEGRVERLSRFFF